MNEALITLSVVVLIARTLDTHDYDECIAIQYVFNKLEGGMTAFKYWRVWYFVLDKEIYIIQLHKTICISLKTVRGVQLSIVGGERLQ